MGSPEDALRKNDKCELCGSPLTVSDKSLRGPYILVLTCYCPDVTCLGYGRVKVYCRNKKTDKESVTDGKMPALSSRVTRRSE